MGRSQDLYKKARRLIPGGTQLLSKRPEMFLPDLWPAYYRKAKGCEVWDLDGKRYVDMSYMGIGACILGYADPDVNRSVKATVEKGNMSTLNAPEEVQLAQVLNKIHPWADMSKFARTGGEAMAIAVRIARAKTGKETVLFCGYHGWHDWYLSANIADNRALDGHLLPGLEPKGVPRTLKGSAVPFKYNDIEGFLKLARKYKGKIAAVVMEPLRNYYPKDGFLEAIRSLTKKTGVVLIFDEITSGWRLTLGGTHLKFKVYPDLCVFAKGMSNGYPMAAIIGRKGVINKAQHSFISSTYWTERIGPVAALATIKKIKENKIYDHLIEAGKAIQKGWKESSEKHNIDINIFGIPPLSHFSFNHKKHLALKTLFTQEMLKKGFLATTAFYASYAHKQEYIDRYLRVLDDVFLYISNVMKKCSPEEYLESGTVCHDGFKRLN